MIRWCRRRLECLSLYFLSWFLSLVSTISTAANIFTVASLVVRVSLGKYSTTSQRHCFLSLAFSLGDIYQFLPAVTWTVQFPYRLLAFVALFTALGLPILLPRLKTLGFLILAFMAIYQSSALIFHLSYREPLLVSPEAIARTYANYDYSGRKRFQGADWTRIGSFSGSTIERP